MSAVWTWGNANNAPNEAMNFARRRSRLLLSLLLLLRRRMGNAPRSRRRRNAAVFSLALVLNEFSGCFFLVSGLFSLARHRERHARVPFWLGEQDVNQLKPSYQAFHRSIKVMKRNEARWVGFVTRVLIKLKSLLSLIVLRQRIVQWGIVSKMIV